MGKIVKEIFLGSDHAGFELKEEIKERLLLQGWKIFDVGAHFFQKEDDYPVFAERLGKEVVRRKIKGILVCGSGEGVCIAANKVKGVRAVTSFDKKGAQLSREHIDANVLCLSAWNLKGKKAEKIVKAWLNAKFSGQARHIRRIGQIKRIENGK